MKKKALLIGNTHGLPGVKVDIERYQSFLKSRTGGAWQDSEIDVLIDPPKSTLELRIALMKILGLDYAMVVFSGHGEQKRDTNLVINKNNDRISESEFNGIADRQLSIYDCCRARPETVTKSFRAFDAALSAITESLDDVRIRYNRRILQALPQHAKLYSCSVGQYSYDTAEGGLYTINLLNAASRVSPQDEFKTVGVAHQEAAQTTKQQAAEKGGQQDPDSWLIKCPSSQSLIISIR